ncbi:MAG: AAA family ATPase [Leadbetterella sp.]|nr:AAA family ATPase [Leadbetterella sp.]
MVLTTDLPLQFAIKWTFEVGGRNKTQKHISGISNAFLALDEIEYGYGNSIPLWLLGFMN